MPLYTLNCPKCSEREQRLIPAFRHTPICKKCGGVMDKEMPTLNGPSEVRETIDNYTGTTWRKDQKEILNERQQNYLWEVEIPRKVASGVYTTETMLEMGWVYIDDDGKIQTHTKPPHARKE